ncbi:MAG TPA: NUDIX hydrolase [Terriglobales bacterium]|nr:NUDIX hydrolase [Terriglobales bacterium]
MKRDYPERPLVGVGAVIVDGGRVVVVRRATAPLQGEWSIPGGMLELGETVREAAVREAREETGLVVEPGEVLGVFDRILPDSEGKIRYHYVLIDLLCRRVGGELRAGGDAAEARWLTAEELQSFPVAEPAAGLLRRALHPS